MKKKILVFGLSMACIGTMLIGCGTKNQDAVAESTSETTTEATTTEKITTEEVTTEEQLEVIGEATETGYEVKLTNCVGQDIVGVRVERDGTFGENLLAEGDSFKSNEKRILYYSGSGSENDNQETVQYNVELTLADESIYVLHAFPFGEMEEGEIYVEDEVAYLKYKGLSTKDDEIAVKEEKKAAATAAAQSKRASSGNSASAPAPEPASAPAPEPAPAPAPEPAPEPAPAPSVDQDAESCIGDEGLTY